MFAGENRPSSHAGTSAARGDPRSPTQKTAFCVADEKYEREFLPEPRDSERVLRRDRQRHEKQRRVQRGARQRVVPLVRFQARRVRHDYLGCMIALR